jgi:hypothetical protein
MTDSGNERLIADKALHRTDMPLRSILVSEIGRSGSL